MGDDRQGPLVSHARGECWRTAARGRLLGWRHQGRSGDWAVLVKRRRGRGNAELGRAGVGQRTGPQAELGPEAVFHYPAPAQVLFSKF